MKYADDDNATQRSSTFSIAGNKINFSINRRFIKLAAYKKRMIYFYANKHDYE